MSDRDTIFAAIRLALDPIAERAVMPEWSDDLVVCKPAKPFDTLKAQFAEKLAFAGSRYYDSLDALAAFLKEEKSIFGYCAPALAAHLSQLDGITFDTEYDESKIHEYTFGITRASAGVAESGTLMLKDCDTSARLAALAPWSHIAVLNEANIIDSIPEAIQWR